MSELNYYYYFFFTAVPENLDFAIGLKDLLFNFMI